MNRIIDIAGKIEASTLKRVAGQLDQMGSGPIDVRIDSQGGSYPDGMAIYELFVAHGNVTTHVVGEACSIASVIMLAGKGRKIYPSARVMIHSASCGVHGTAQELAEAASALHVHSKTLVELYVAHTTATEESLTAAIKTDTWMTAEDALAFGFVDAITRDVAPIPVKTGPVKRAAAADKEPATIPFKPQELSPATGLPINPNLTAAERARLIESEEMVAEGRALHAEMWGGYPARLSMVVDRMNASRRLAKKNAATVATAEKKAATAKRHAEIQADWGRIKRQQLAEMNAEANANLRRLKIEDELRKSKAETEHEYQRLIAEIQMRTLSAERDLCRLKEEAELKMQD